MMNRFQKGLKAGRRRNKSVGLEEDTFLRSKKIAYLSYFLFNYLKTGEGIVEDEFFGYVFSILNEFGYKNIIEEIAGSPGKTELDMQANAINRLKERKKLTGNTKKRLQDVFTHIEKETSEKSFSNSIFYSRISRLKEIFRLSDFEFELIVIFYLLSNDSRFEDAFEKYNGYKSAHQKILFASFICEKKCSETLRVLTDIAPLRKLQILDSDLDIETHIFEYLIGLNSDPIESRYFVEYRADFLPLDSFFNLEEKIRIISSLIVNKKENEGLNILFYGSPGTGKTAFSRAIGHFLDLKIYEISQFENETNKDSFRYAALTASYNLLDNRKNLIIIDEADELLNGSSGRFFSSGRNVEKGLINEILDKSQHICIWITNEYHHIDQSTRRRFDYSIEFAPLSIEARKCIWRNSLLKHGMGNSISTKDIELLSSKYNTSAGGINIALKNCMKLTKSKENSEILESIELLLKSHQEIMDASKIDKFFPGCENYSLEGLSVKSSLPLNKIIGIGRKFYFQRKSHFMANSNLKNINILLHGPPGTGKTEFARHLAEKLEKSLITKRGSDLLDIFVGGTEQNIRNSFRETENEDAILFIDEVDGLIADRGYASRNWEVTQVNELLGQMEDFKGILICATNFKSRMDSASIRRFALKIEFDWLDDKGKLIFFNRMLLHLSNSPLKNKEKELLKSINHLAPGDYRAVHQRFSFLDNECIKNIDLINALNEEVANKNSSHNSPIGFMK